VFLLQLGQTRLRAVMRRVERTGESARHGISRKTMVSPVMAMTKLWPNGRKRTGAR
jgi:hypothetical protein